MRETGFDVEVEMMIPFTSIILYPDQLKDDYIEDPTLKKIREMLNIEIDILALAERLYTRKTNFIEVYYSNSTYKKYIIFDTYIGGSDQLEFIKIYIFCESKCGYDVRVLAHEFYTNRCFFNVQYTESTGLISKRFKTDFTKIEEAIKLDYIKDAYNDKIVFYKAGNIIASNSLV